MNRGMWVTCRTEEQAERLRRAGYNVTIKPPGGQDSPDYSYCLQDLRSSADGSRLGRQFGHDSFRLARALGLAIQRVPLFRLQNKKTPGVTIMGRIWLVPGSEPFVQLADSLNDWEAHKALAHEIGHFLGFPDERLCNQFADNFLKVDDSELPGAAWRKREAEILARERARGGRWRRYAT